MKNVNEVLPKEMQAEFGRRSKLVNYHLGILFSQLKEHTVSTSMNNFILIDTTYNIRAQITRLASS